VSRERRRHRSWSGYRHDRGVTAAWRVVPSRRSASPPLRSASPVRRYGDRVRPIHGEAAQLRPSAASLGPCPRALWPRRATRYADRINLYSPLNCYKYSVGTGIPATTRSWLDQKLVQPPGVQMVQPDAPDKSSIQQQEKTFLSPWHLTREGTTSPPSLRLATIVPAW
jgi:hypothetical protein